MSLNMSKHCYKRLCPSIREWNLERLRYQGSHTYCISNSFNRSFIRSFGGVIARLEFVVRKITGVFSHL